MFWYINIVGEVILAAGDSDGDRHNLGSRPAVLAEEQDCRLHLLDLLLLVPFVR